jgi:hypothetical protein
MQTGTFVRCLVELNLVHENGGPINCVAKSLYRISGACGVGFIWLKFKKP